MEHKRAIAPRTLEQLGELQKYWFNPASVCYVKRVLLTEEEALDRGVSMPGLYYIAYNIYGQEAIILKRRCLSMSLHELRNQLRPLGVTILFAH